MLPFMRASISDMSGEFQNLSYGGMYMEPIDVIVPSILTASYLQRMPLAKTSSCGRPYQEYERAPVRSLTCVGRSSFVLH